MLAILIESAARSAALALAVWCILSLCRVRNPQLHRLAWLTVLVAALAMPLLMKVTELPVGRAPALLTFGAIETLTFASVAGTPGLTWGELLLEFYVVATLVMALRYVYAIAKLWRVRRLARPLVATIDASDVRTTTACRSPVLVGSTILVPSDFGEWDSLRQRAVIAHERMHVANGDFYVQMVAQLHRIVFWFSPLSWWLPSRLTMASEQLSDDAAIVAIEERASYAEILLGFAQGSGVSRDVVAMARPATVVRRIERILAEEQVPGRPGWRRVGALFVAILPCVLATAGLSSSAARAAQAPSERLALTGSPVATEGVVLPRSSPMMPLAQPAYPAWSRRLREEGTVVLHLFVLADGSVGGGEIARSSGYPVLDDAALYTAQGWRLDPGTLNGTPTDMWGRFAVTFKLSD
jgi:TonB family protein